MMRRRAGRRSVKAGWPPFLLPGCFRPSIVGRGSGPTEEGCRCAVVSGCDLRDRATGEAENAVLRHCEAQCLVARQSGIEAAQDPRDDAVSDGNDRSVAEI